MLPIERKVKKAESVFPTRWQAVLFRNYGFVPDERLAKVLSCTKEDVLREAKSLGLQNVSFDQRWQTDGYITIIRNNWDLLPYGQLAELVGVDLARLEYLLKEEDFLSGKLGNFKPECNKAEFVPLNGRDREKTERLGEIIRSFYGGERGRYFDFTFDGKKEESLSGGAHRRIVHGYFTPCGKPLDVDGKNYLSDELLQSYADCGVNGLWMHGVLSTLSPYPFKPQMSENYQERRKKLNDLIARAARFGVKIFLYFNEPRCLESERFEKTPHLAGTRIGNYTALCTSTAEVKQYLYESVKDLVSSAEGLGGIITITMSENLTHCNSQTVKNCPRCKDIPPEQSASEVNNVIYKAVNDSGKDVEVIANLWGWSPFMGWTEAQAVRGIELLNKGISVMCVSEYGLGVQKGGVKTTLTEYSLANVGPSRIAKTLLKRAGKLGHRVYAKIQINNSWECSAVPYLPVFDLVYKHLKNLSKAGVYDYMLSWTLGGYPSVTADMVCGFSENERAFSLKEWYLKHFASDAKIVRRSVRFFCKALKKYPVSLNSLYFSPKNLGAANLWSLEKDDRVSAMVGSSFDDYETWIFPYPLQTYLLQMRRLLNRWKKGLNALERAKGSAAGRLYTYSKAAYGHFLADLLHTEYAFYKRNIAKYKREFISVVAREERLCKEMIYLQRTDAFIGYEASNHYFYTDRNLVEKLLQLRAFREKIKERQE